MYFDDEDNGLRSKRKRCANCKYGEYDKTQGYIYAATIQANM